MRSLLIGVSLGCAAALSAGGALAQDAPPAANPHPVVTWDEGLNTPDVISAAFGNGAASLASGPTVSDVAVTPAGTIAWTSRETWFQSGASAIDRLRVTSGTAMAQAPGAPLWINPTLGDQIFDVSYTRGWPAAVSVRAPHYGFDVTPHAGLGVTSAGESAEAGATVRFGAPGVLDQLGMRGQPGKFYLYAQTSGRAVGYNFMHSDAGWRPANLFTQAQPGYVGDAEAGVAWRRGDVQASFGYVQRAIHMQTVRDADVDSHESLVAFTISLRPRR